MNLRGGFNHLYISDITCVVSLHQMTPLHLAAERGRSHVVKYLAEHGANVNIPNDKGVCLTYNYMTILLEMGSYKWWTRGP